MLGILANMAHSSRISSLAVEFYAHQQILILSKICFEALIHTSSFYIGFFRVFFRFILLHNTKQSKAKYIKVIRGGKVTYIKINSSIHHLLSVVLYHLCALEHLGTHKADTS